MIGEWQLSQTIEQVHNKDCLHAASNTMPEHVNTFQFTEGTTCILLVFCHYFQCVHAEFMHLLATTVVEQYSSVSLAVCKSFQQLIFHSGPL